MFCKDIAVGLVECLDLFEHFENGFDWCFPCILQIFDSNLAHVLEVFCERRAHLAQLLVPIVHREIAVEIMETEVVAWGFCPVRRVVEDLLAQFEWETFVVGGLFLDFELADVLSRSPERLPVLPCHLLGAFPALEFQAWSCRWPSPRMSWCLLREIRVAEVVL